jgi:hypothetical protein
MLMSLDLDHTFVSNDDEYERCRREREKER